MRIQTNAWMMIVASCAMLACGGDDAEYAAPNSISGSDAGAVDQGSSDAEDNSNKADATNSANNVNAENNVNSTNNGGDMGSTLLDDVLARLRSDRDAALMEVANNEGWPLQVVGGYLFVSTNPALNLLAGDHDDWVGTTMQVEDDFAWVVLDVEPGTRYKFTDLETWVSDGWSRAYTFDEFGEISWVRPSVAHLERFFAIGDSAMPGRMVRVWVPEAGQDVTHTLYAHDGQNLFDPRAVWGGWKLQESVPEGMMVVAIDNTGNSRLEEYTHVADDIGGGPVGGQGDAYADFVVNTVRALVQTHYGEANTLGVMGSSLGGLISFHIADRHEGVFHFAASLSGTMGWGSIGATNETMIQRYTGKGVRSTALYLDSGGNGGTCVDSDSDGTNDDDNTATDNYCENKQFEAVLVAEGYVYDQNLWHWHEPGASHSEAAWAARVDRPLAAFSAITGE